MSTPRKQQKKAVKPARRDSRASSDATVTPSIFGGSLLSLESRIMFDGAAVATASIVNSEQTAQNQAEDSFSAGDATVDAPTGEPSATADQALLDALESLDVSAARQEMLFVSTSVLDYQQLLNGISPDVEAQILDPARDGVEQMADTFSIHTGIHPVNLIGDGTEAGMHLSSSFLIQHSISTSHAEQFQQIGQSLSVDADLLVHGSSFGQGEAGQLALDTLANLTGADVAASKDRTGYATENADWLLEVTTGSIETSSVISETTSGAIVGQGNLISGTTFGVQTDNRDNRTIQGNRIGTDVSSTGIALNAFEVQILGNAIYSDTGLGINVDGVSSVTTNDAPAAADSTIDVISGALAPARVEIVFVDTSVENYQALIDGIDNPDARVVLLDASRDGMEQIVAALGQVGRVDAIHLISHGDEGELKLGSTILNGDNMQGEYADELAAIKEHLTDAADILVYGCSFGKGEAGMAAAETLGRLTGADVAASTDATGHAELGGDWDLELQQGSIETDLAVDRDAQDNWSGLLGIVDWDGQTWTAGIATPAVQSLTLADGSTVSVTLTQNSAGTLTSAATSASYTGGLVPAQSALQLGMAINPPTDTITVRVDFSSQPGGSVNNVSMTLFDVDNAEYAVFSSNLGNPTSATVSATNTFNGTNRVSGNNTGANQTTGDGNTTVTFNQTGITWVEFTYGSTSNAAPIVVLHDVLFNSIADANGPKLDLNDNDAAVSASDNFNTLAYNNASGGTVPWASNWIEVDAAGAGAGAGEVRVVDVLAGAGVDGEIRIGRDTNTVSSIQRAVDLTNYVNPTLSFDYNTSGTLEVGDILVVEVSSNGGVSFTTLQTFADDGTGTANLSLSGYESGNTIIRFRVTGGYTAANEFFYVDNVTISAEPTGFSSAYTEGGAGAAISDTDVVITDANSANMSGGKVSITTNFTAGDSLTFTNVGSVSGSYSSGTGVLTITGTGTIAEYQTFLASVRYSSSSDDPTVGGTKATRIISTTVQDQTTLNPSNMVFSTVAITAVNDAPNIVDATVALNENSTNGSAVTNVSDSFTGTDLDRDGQAITYNITGGNTGGAFTINSATGAITVANSAVLDFETTPSFTLTVTASDGSLSDTAAITVNVTNVNEAPVAGDDTATTPQNTAVTTGNVLGNDSDPESVLNAGNITAFDAVSANGGRVVNNGDGTFTYTPALNFTGTDTFTYTVSDGVLTDTATVTITVTPAGGNSVPTLMTNAGAIVLAGFSDPITSDQLQVTDADNTPAQLLYTVSSAPLNGRLELATAPGMPITSFTQADINAGRLVYVHNGSASTGDSFTFTVSDGAGGTIAATTFNLTVMPFSPPPVGWPPAPEPASVPFTDLPGPPSVGVLRPALAPSSELTWSPGRQNPDGVQAKIVAKHDEPAPREKMVSKTFTSVEHVEPEDIVPQEPSDLPPDSQSPLVKKVLAVGHNFEERLTKEADILEQAIEERIIVTALSTGFMVWLLRRGSSLTSSFTAMLGRRKDDEQGNG